jgi:hypothetical protein
MIVEARAQDVRMNDVLVDPVEGTTTRVERVVPSATAVLVANPPLHLMLIRTAEWGWLARADDEFVTLDKC